MLVHQVTIRHLGNDSASRIWLLSRRRKAITFQAIGSVSCIAWAPRCNSFWFSIKSPAWIFGDEMRSDPSHDLHQQLSLQSDLFIMLCHNSIPNLIVEFPSQSVFHVIIATLDLLIPDNQLNSFMYDDQLSTAFMFHTWTEYDSIVTALD